MKALSIILTCALIGTMGWFVIDSRSEAKGMKNQLDLLRRQQPANGTTIADDKQMAALESQLLAEQMNKKAPAPTAAAPASGPIFPASVSPPMSSSTVGRTPAITSALQAANAA